LCSVSIIKIYEFKTIFKKAQSVPFKNNMDESEKLKSQREDCPLDKDELG